MSARLNSFKIGNFKAFASSQRVPVKPITLIFGPNSAGKSSFIHGLALAHAAQFAPEKERGSRLDVHRTEVGGSTIDLGGYRQFVHRAQLRKGVEWGAEINVSALSENSRYQRLSEMLSGVKVVSLNITLGMVLDNEDRAIAGTSPHIKTIEILVDGHELVRMSRRPGEDAIDSGVAELSIGLKVDADHAVERFLGSAAEDGYNAKDVLGLIFKQLRSGDGELEEGAFQTLRIDRMASDHFVLRRVIDAIVEAQTFALSPREDEINDQMVEILSRLEVRVDRFLPSGVAIQGVDVKSNGDIATALNFWLPRALNDLIKGISDVLAWELKQLQYLGPLRSFPARHLAYDEQGDGNWYAGGGYAWDVVRNSKLVRDDVNRWLGSERLKTPYELRIKHLVHTEELGAPLADALTDRLSQSRESSRAEAEGGVDEDAEDYSQWSVSAIEAGTEAGKIDSVRELFLIDKRTNTRLTHRDVGIGISQVLPVLVMAYASRNKLIAMEQPEIHLHPALQADLADVFIESSMGERNNTFILETHSEHLMLRLMRRIREGAIDAGDVSIIFVEPQYQGSRFVEIRLDEDGDFMDERPGGFFEESFHEKFAGR